MKKQYEYQLEIDSLAVGLTRPPIFMGVNLRLFFANMVVSFLLCINTHSIYVIPFFVVLHLLMLKLSTKDVNFASLWMKWLTKTPPLLNSWYWGRTNSYQPW